jgi:hypothetical protein
MASCYKCGKPLNAGLDSAVLLDAICEQCSSWVHACANCTHYDEYSMKKCRESKAPFVFDRLGKNDCAFFRLKTGAKLEEERGQKKKASPRMEERDRAGRARDNLNKLFGS